MGSKWNGSRDLGGILRKSNKHTSESSEPRGGDLLVFGYACKVFRDDEKALHIDQGKHLIPWMGDKTLKIDRAALSDLSHYEPPPGGYTNRLDCLTPAEQRAEQLCEEERYYSLYHNEEEEQMYQEEELKRLHQEGSTSYGQVQFDYNNQTSNEHKTDDDKLEEFDEIFTPPYNFSIPPNIELPETMKQHAIIEKTAKFISGQGAQMEILIKAKQSNNPQFEFLNQNNRLNHYYKFVLLSFKNGTYPAEVQKTEAEKSNVQSQIAATAPKSSTISMESIQSTFAQPKLPVPILKYKPSANCSYTQLISKIKGVPLPKEQPEVETKTHDKNESIKFLDYSSYYGNQSIDMITTPLVTTNNTEMPTQPAVSSPKINTDGVEIKKISTGLMLAQCYASDTEDENDSFENVEPPPAPNIPTPPDSLQNIIDKTAIYVAKNGKQFENILRTKQDERFSFLDTTDEFYPYYLHKVTGLNSSYSISNGDDKPKSMTPVSFSIKPKEESSVPINPALLQETSDDDDSENKIRSTTPTTISQNPTSIISVPDQQSQQQQHVQIKIPIDENQLAIKGTSFVTNIPISSALAAIAARNTTTSSSYSAGQTVPRSRFDVDNTGAIVNRLNNPIAPPSPTIRLEAQQKELKRAEEKVKDRLAQIAREKLGLISKEKQLQLERKKKAMAFLNQIKSSGTTRSTSIITTTTTTPTIEDSIKLKSECSTDSDSSSVHSIPLSTTIIDDDELPDTAGTIDLCTSVEKIKDSEIQEDNKNGDEIKRRSRSKSSSHHQKKKKSKHSKKKSKKRSRSRSQSSSREHKRSKRSSSRKSKKRHRES